MNEPLTEQKVVYFATIFKSGEIDHQGNLCSKEVAGEFGYPLIPQKDVRSAVEGLREELINAYHSYEPERAERVFTARECYMMGVMRGIKATNKYFPAFTDSHSNTSGVSASGKDRDDGAALESSRESSSLEDSTEATATKGEDDAR